MSEIRLSVRTALAMLTLVGAVLLPGLATAQAAEDPHAELPGFAPRGADTCLTCHDGDPNVMPIFESPHGSLTDSRAPMGNIQCDACHGPGEDHARRLRPRQERPPVFAFGKSSILSRDEENEICLTCHKVQGRTHTHWYGSVHQREELACVDCHRIHIAQDPIRDAKSQAQVCYQCHTRVQAQTFQPSVHPIRQGLMSCSDCHQAHGTLTEAMLVRPTLNETCYSCHAEKRGPFLWEHVPSVESCANCHEPHGSIHSPLLVRRAPLLCQSCHSRAGHPSIAQTGDRLPGGRPSSFLLAGSCTNCHSQVHGSNHPSGANLSR
jgi:DmsE family decaheme c-type cytochrome